MRAAFGAERDAARRRDEQEARVLVASVVERIEAAGDERVVERADREQPRRRTGRRTSPAAASIRNRLLSAMPSSMCWPLLSRAHFCADAIFALAKTSAISLRRNSPRWLTQAPRLVETVTSGEVVTIRSARSPPAFDRSSRMRPNAAWVDCSSPAGAGRAGTLDRAEAARALLAGDAAALEQRLDAGPRIVADAFERLPFLAFAHAHRVAQRGHLGRVHQAGVIVLVAGEGQAEALDRPGDEQGRDVVLRGVERLDQRLHAMAAEVGEQRRQRGIVMLLRGMRAALLPSSASIRARQAAPPW